MSSEGGDSIATYIVNEVIQEGIMPNNWGSNTGVSSYNCKKDALGRNNYKGNKLLEPVMKGAGRIITLKQKGVCLNVM